MCTSIDYLWIINCADCTQVAWCGLQLQSITGKSPNSGYSLFLQSNPGISDMCGIKNLSGALTGGFKVYNMNGVVSLDGAEGITSVGVSNGGNGIFLSSNPILTSAIVLTNTEYPAGTLVINGNTILECVPSAWPATDKGSNTIPHGSCPTTPSTAPTASPTTAPTVAPTVDAVSCTMADGFQSTSAPITYYRVTTNAQLLGLSTCTSIDYLYIDYCTDCTQAAWCGLQLQSITGKDPAYGYSLYLGSTPGISDMCGVKDLTGALSGGFEVNYMNGLVSLDGAEGITSVGVNSDGISIEL
jgi:hypothetical protein